MITVFDFVFRTLVTVAFFITVPVFMYLAWDTLKMYTVEDDELVRIARLRAGDARSHEKE